MNSFVVPHIRFHRHGDATVLWPESLELEPPGPGEVRVRHAAIGVNFVDVYHRTGLYPLPALPATPGVEAAGTVEAVGPGVVGFSPGQRVAYAGLPAGAYASARNLRADQLLPLPVQTATAIALVGLSAAQILALPAQTAAIEAASQAVDPMRAWLTIRKAGGGTMQVRLAAGGTMQVRLAAGAGFTIEGKSVR